MRTDGKHHAATSCSCSGVTCWHSATFSSSSLPWINTHSNVHLNSPSPVCVRHGFDDVGHVRSAPPHLSHDPKGTLNSFPCLPILCGGKNTHTHYNRLLLLLCVKAFPPVTRAVRWVEGCVKYQCERSAGWAAAQRDRGSGPAVDLISPMGLPAGKACLI